METWCFRNIQPPAVIVNHNEMPRRTTMRNMADGYYCIITGYGRQLASGVKNGQPFMICGFHTGDACHSILIGSSAFSVVCS